MREKPFRNGPTKEGEMTLDMNMGMVSEMTTEMRTSPSYWDHTLVESPENPFPLAPADLVKKGLVTGEKYEEENKKWGEKWASIMTEELSHIEPGHIEIFGAGLRRDLTWVPGASAAGHSISIRDWSTVACDGARKYVEEEKLENVEVTQTEILKGFQSGEIDSDKTNVCFASQYFQNQDLDEVWNSMRWLGGLLTTAPASKRVIYLIHPRGEDNNEEEVKWNNTIPYTDDDLFRGLYFEIDYEQPGMRPKIEVIGTHKYFDHQTYTMFRITLDQPVAGKEE